MHIWCKRLHLKRPELQNVHVISSKPNDIEYHLQMLHCGHCGECVWNFYAFLWVWNILSSLLCRKFVWAPFITCCWCEVCVSFCSNARSYKICSRLLSKMMFCWLLRVVLRQILVFCFIMMHVRLHEMWVILSDYFDRIHMCLVSWIVETTAVHPKRSVNMGLNFRRRNTQSQYNETSTPNVYSKWTEMHVMIALTQRERLNRY